MRKRSIRIAAAAASLVTAAALALLGGGAAAADPAPPAMTVYTYASFIVPGGAVNAAVGSVPVQGIIEGGGPAATASTFTVRMICNAVSFYPVSTFSFGPGSVSFTAHVPVSEAGHTCIVTATSSRAGQLVRFAPAHVFSSGGAGTSDVVSVIATAVTRSVIGGL